MNVVVLSAGALGHGAEGVENVIDGGAAPAVEEIRSPAKS